MPHFVYRARDSKGSIVKGEVEAANNSAAADQIVRRGVIPILIEEKGEDPPWMLKLRQFVVGTVTFEHKLIFCRQMYSLMKSGIPILRAIIGLADTTTSKVLKQTLKDLAEQLEKGKTLSAAMSQYPAVFNRLTVSIVHVGENTGKLDEAFLQLTEYFETEQETRRRIKQATRYPMMVMMFITVAVVFVNIFVIPTFSDMFAKFKTELPWSTRLLIGMSDFFINKWPLLVAGVVGGLVMIKSYLNTEAGQKNLDHYKLKAPIIGSIIERSVLSRYSRTFAIMLHSGVPLTTALQLVSEAVDNTYMAEKIIEMRQSIERGESLLRVSMQSKMFTPLVMQMVAVGEETGRVDELLKEVADYYDREVDFDLKNLTSKIEPMLIGVVAGFVAILALGIFSPMWDMMSAMK
ncbi:type II secretion system F family protein [Algicola sagamiensis]|uniref:type II secretion system F family protein n=1 Tax=Algicola sagamiensis TaxID=163869 RepID=UPI000362C980|nr:type II secretion system F family protein [Algicola sagamiensis]